MMNWCSFLVLCLTYIYVSAKPVDISDEDRKAIGIFCLKETGADIGIINEAIATQTAINDDTYKKFLTCSYKLQGYQKDDGTIIFDNIKHFLTRFYKVEDLKVIEPCRDIKDINDAENAFNTLDCVLENLKTIDPK